MLAALPNENRTAPGKAKHLKEFKATLRSCLSDLTSAERDALPSLITFDVNHAIGEVSYKPALKLNGRAPTVTRKCQLFVLSIADVLDEAH